MTDRRCSSCGGLLPEKARFCPFCGLSVRTAPALGERRLVSVLFADIEGFTTLAEHRDPESVKALLDECMDDLLPVVEAHGGHVDKIIGDEVMAVFGAPSAHEDDAERAVRAGMALIDGLAAGHPELRLRVGINTGEVLAGTVGSEGGYTVTGDVVNTAHRLAGAAEPGEVLVADRTRQACVGAIGFKGRRLLEVKGRQDPVVVWVADRVLTASLERDDREPRSPLVGRQADLDDLHRRVLEAFSRQRSEVIVLVGEAGVGKTRLASELLERFDSDPESGRVVWSNCSPYDTEGDLGLLAELVRSVTGVHGPDEADQQLLALDRRLDTLGLADPLVRARLAETSGVGVATPSLPVDAETLAVRSGPGEAHLAALSALLAAEATQRPLLVVVDDLHWAGARTVRYLRNLPNRLRQAPLVVLLLGRDDTLEKYGRLLVGRRVTIRTLDPLSPMATSQLVNSVLAEFDPTGRMGPDANDRLVRAAGGNPLLVEQLVRFLIESGHLAKGDERWTWDDEDSTKSALPDGVRSLIGARLDALSVRDRSLLADAAVFGRVFWRSALVEACSQDRRAVDATLTRLARVGLVEPDPDSGRDAWRFCHSLTCDVAYAGIPLAERSDRHAAAARWLERTIGEYPDPRTITAIAHHYERAVLLGRSVGHVDTSAVRPAFAAVLRAARDERGREGLRRADRWYRRARSMGSPDPEDMIEAVAEHGQVLLELRQLDEAEEAFEEVARRAGATRPPMAASAEAHLGAVARLQGETGLARERFDSAVAQWRALDDLQGVADTLRLEGWAEFAAGRSRAALPRLERAAAMEGQLDEPIRHGETLRYLGWCECLEGRLESSADHLRAAVTASEESGDAGTAAFCQGLLGFVLLRAAHAEDALFLAREVRRMAASGSDPWAEWSCATLEAASLVGLGDAEAGRHLAEEAIGWFDELGDEPALSLARLVGASAARALDDTRTARRLIGEVLDSGRPQGRPLEDARAFAELAELEMASERVDDAEVAARSSLALARAGVGDNESGLRALTVLAKVALERGDTETAELLLEEAAEPCQPGDRSEAWRRAALSLADLRVEQGDLDSARALLEDAGTPPTDLVALRERSEDLRRCLDAD